MTVLYIFSFCIIGLGVFFTACKRKELTVGGVLLTINGLVIFTGLYTNNNILISTLILSAGIICISSYGYAVGLNRRCTRIIDCICEGFSQTSTRGGTFYAPKVYYTVEGIEYHRTLPENYKKKYIPYVENKHYKIRINENNPEECVKDNYSAWEKSKFLLIFGIFISLIWAVMIVSVLCGVATIQI